MQFVEAFAPAGDGAAQIPDPEVDTLTDLQPLLYSRSLSAWKWWRQDGLLFCVVFTPRSPCCCCCFFSLLSGSSTEVFPTVNFVLLSVSHHSNCRVLLASPPLCLICEQLLLQRLNHCSESRRSTVAGSPAFCASVVKTPRSPLWDG